MVHIENKSVKIAGKQTNYAKLLSEVIKATPEGGFTFESMKTHLRIDAKINEKDKKIVLENTDYDYLMSVIKKQKYNIMDIQLVEMFEYINKLKKS